MTGQQTLFTTLFPSSIGNDPKRKGVSNLHTGRRDEFLAYRFYYYNEMRRIRYDDVLGFLEQEFFITPAVIVQRLTENRSFIKDIIDAKPTIGKLRKLYPWFLWP